MTTENANPKAGDRAAVEIPAEMVKVRGTHTLAGEYVPDHDSRNREAEAILVVRGRNVAGYGLGAVPPDMASRQVCGGPLVPGPWAFAFPHCGVIDQQGGTRAILARARAEGRLVEVDLGGVVVIAGERYRVEAASKWDRDNIRLVRLTS